jgi:glutamate-1-semialdehyde aminotransferase
MSQRQELQLQGQEYLNFIHAIHSDETKRIYVHNQDLFAKLQGRLIKNRVMVDESNSEPFYTSAAHDDNDLEQTLQAFEISMRVSSKSIKKGKERYKR